MNANHSIKVQERKEETENTGVTKLNRKCEPIMNTKLQLNKFSI
jgi:hypothetical protein